MKLTVTNNLIQPLKMTSEMVKSAWASIGYFLHHFDLDIRKIMKRIEQTSSLKGFEKETMCQIK